MISKKTVETHTVNKFVESVTCDLCGQTFTHVQELSGGIDWDKYCDFGRVAQTGVWIGERKDDRAGHTVYYKHYHVCEDCFRGKLEPWLQSQGATPTLVEDVW